MEKLLFLLVMAMIAGKAMAQMNPKPGFIITNQGDTVRGTLDFRTNARMTKQCSFRAEGESEMKTYKPGEIEGFRFDNGGKYFVSRRLNVTGTPELYFAEFIVQGMMNLYCVVYNDDEHFFFERGDGEMAEMTKRKVDYSPAKSTVQEEEELAHEKREQYGSVRTLLKDSWNAVRAFDGKDLSRRKMVSVVRQYHNDLCTDGSTCMEYAYDEKSENVKCYVKVFAGYSYFIKSQLSTQVYPDVNYTCGALEFGAGLELELQRLLKGFSVEGRVAYMPKIKSTKDFVDDNYNYSYEQIVRSTYQRSAFSIDLGGVERFGSGKFQPFVRAGIDFSIILGQKEKRYLYAPADRDMSDLKHLNDQYLGAYIGAGVKMMIGKHFASLHADLFKSLRKKCDVTRVAAVLEFGF